MRCQTTSRLPPHPPTPIQCCFGLKSMYIFNNSCVTGKTELQEGTWILHVTLHENVHVKPGYLQSEMEELNVNDYITSWTS